MSGPLSAKWLKDHHGEADIIFVAKRRVFKAGKRKVKNSLEEGVGTKRRKIGGELRHLVYTLKKVARLSSKDRCDVFSTLKKYLGRVSSLLDLNQLVKEYLKVLLTKPHLLSLLIKSEIIGWFYMVKRRRWLRMCGEFGRPLGYS